MNEKFLMSGIAAILMFSQPILAGQEEEEVVVSGPQSGENGENIVDPEHVKVKEKTIRRGDLPRIHPGDSPVSPSKKSGSENGSSGE